MVKNCFPPDTPILTKNGSKSLESIKVGDEVYSYNSKTNKVELQPVTELHNVIIPMTENIKLTTSNEQHFITSIKQQVLTTGVGGKEWYYKPAGELEIGDFMLYSTNDGVNELKITKLKQVDRNLNVSTNFKDITVAVNDGYLCGVGGFCVVKN